MKKILNLIFTISILSFSANAEKTTAGLRNPSSVCYMNSVVQCLANTKLGDYLIANKINFQQNIILGPLTSLIEQLKTNTTPQVSQKLITEQRNLFFGGSTRIQDSSEFLNELLYRLPANAKSIFTIETQTSTKCIPSLGGCGQKFNQKTPHTMLGLGLGNNTTLRQSLNDFFQGGVAEELRCETCNKFGTKNKIENISTFPEIFILHLKRYKLINDELKKDNKPISFPVDNLDLKTYSFNKDKQNAEYDLVGIICHINDSTLSLQAGHYYSYIKYNNEWYKYDDTNVNRIGLNEINRIASAGIVKENDTPYILFYKRKDISTPVVTSLGSKQIATKEEKLRDERLLIDSYLAEQFQKEELARIEIELARQDKERQEQIDRDFALALQLQD